MYGQTTIITHKSSYGEASLQSFEEFPFKMKELCIQAIGWNILIQKGQ